ncbi:MAG: helix-turn-helix domain-containing protein [Bacteroidota bacterium]
MNVYPEIGDLTRDFGVSDAPKSPLFHILKIEDHFSGEPLIVEPYKHHFFELSFGTGHDVDCKIGSSFFKAINNTLSFASPYQISSWRINRFHTNSLGYMIFFKPELIYPLRSRRNIYREYPFYSLHTSPFIHLDNTSEGELVPLLEQLYLEYAKSGFNMNIAMGFLMVLLEKIKNLYADFDTSKGFESRAEEITFRFEQLIREQNNYRIPLSAYADSLHITPDYLGECIKRVTGKTPLKIVREYVIVQAKSMLTHSTDTISNIAFDLGFEDPSNFVKYFKKYTGDTPSRYRKDPG